MAFGQGYQPRESVKLLPGEYEAGIIGARYEQTKNGTPYLAVYVQIKGHPGAKPNCMTFYDRPYAGQKEMERWDEKWTEFCDAFHLPRTVTEDFASWHGKKGWIRCVPQKSNPEFSNIYPLVKRPGQTAQQTQGPAVPPSGQMPQEYTPVEQQDFPEDIPF